MKFFSFIIYYFVVAAKLPSTDVCHTTFTSDHQNLETFNAEFIKENIDPKHHSKIKWSKKPQQKTDYAFIFLHGLAETSHGMDEISEWLLPRGNQFLLSLQDHGLGEKALHQAKYEDWLNQINQSIAFAKENLGQKIILVGFSLGGTLALVDQFIHKPEPTYKVDGLFLLNPIVWVNPSLVRYVESKFKFTFGEVPSHSSAILLGETNAFQKMLPMQSYIQLGRLSQLLSEVDLNDIAYFNSRLEERGLEISMIYSQKDVMLDKEQTKKFTKLMQQGGSFDIYAASKKIPHTDIIRKLSNDKTYKFDRAMQPMNQLKIVDAIDEAMTNLIKRL